MSSPQPGIAAPPPLFSRYLTFSFRNSDEAASTFASLLERVDGAATVVGVGLPLADRLAVPVPGLGLFPNFSTKTIEIPATQGALWLWLRGDDRAELLLRGEALTELISPAFARTESIEGFFHQGGRDLTGYEDGTENPKGEALVEAAFTEIGASFVAIQKWRHDLGSFAELPEKERDAIIGRERTSNAELEDAPVTAHVKRTAQESFEPEAFVLRRSLPWMEGDAAGLYFVAFGHSHNAFDAQLRRMTGEEDGEVDGLFRFSAPETGGYYYCPPVENGRILWPPVSDS